MLSVLLGDCQSTLDIIIGPSFEPGPTYIN